MGDTRRHWRRKQTDTKTTNMDTLTTGGVRRKRQVREKHTGGAEQPDVTHEGEISE